MQVAGSGCELQENLDGKNHIPGIEFGQLLEVLQDAASLWDGICKGHSR